VIVDTSVWVDHFLTPSGALTGALDDGSARGHEMVVGELALGSLRRRKAVLAYVSVLERAPLATGDEVRRLIEVHRLWGRGLSLVDVHLLASARIGGLGILTNDRGLLAAAHALGIWAEPTR
jgi:predicted nucleic acid-binding protein